LTSERRTIQGLLSTMMMLPTRISFAGFIKSVRKKWVA
jgi:hypothetical protein